MTRNDRKWIRFIYQFLNFANDSLLTDRRLDVDHVYVLHFPFVFCLLFFLFFVCVFFCFVLFLCVLLVCVHRLVGTYQFDDKFLTLSVLPASVIDSIVALPFIFISLLAALCQFFPNLQRKTS